METLRMTFKLPSLLYKSALIQRAIEAEQRQSRPDWLRVIRLRALRLKLMDRLRAATQRANLGLQARPASYAC
jgi:hypothetical protein